MNNEISKQWEQISSNKNRIELIAPCTLNHGILPLSELEQYKVELSAIKDQITLFIPASGSGSRMFSFLFDLTLTKQENELSRLFFKKMDQFPFASLIEGFFLPRTIGEKIDLIDFLLSERGLNYNVKPKGLIPFFSEGGRNLTPFQLHVLQAKELLGNQPKIHFTIQEEFRSEIESNIHEICNDTSDVSFSFQKKETDAYCFDDHGVPVVREGELLRRPAGHGALLANLNSIQTPYVLIKNIDNVQFEAKISLKTWRSMLGLLIDFRKRLYAAAEAKDEEAFNQLNATFAFYREEFSGDFDSLLVKPIRVCGMVRNEGKPGGGPFWIKVEDHLSNQIVELSQIAVADSQQMSVVEASTHFNPVFMACSTHDAFGNKIDLEEFSNENLFLKVRKQDNGEYVSYRELPGLWNGSMHEWLTIFVEIPSDVFTPVKTVIDLL